MMPQMNSDEPIQGQPGSAYGRYEGNQGYSQQQYGTPPYGQAPQSGTYDDDFVDALAQRLSQRMTQEPAGKLRVGTGQKVSPGQRLALAIVSVAMLVPLAALLLVATGGAFFGFVSFGAACLAIFLINAVFNGSSWI